MMEGWSSTAESTTQNLSQHTMLDGSTLGSRCIILQLMPISATFVALRLSATILQRYSSWIEDTIMLSYCSNALSWNARDG
jgi:hypothetical protein